MSIYCPESCDCKDCAPLERWAIRILIALCVAVAFMAVFGCAGSRKPLIVHVPAQCPEPPLMQRPHLPISDLSPGASPDEVAKATLASFELLKGYAAQCEAVLDGYRKH